MQNEQQLFPTETDHLVAAIAVRRDVQTIAGGIESPPLTVAVQSARLSLTALSTLMIGADPEVIYRRLIEAIVSIEHVAVNTRIAHPDLELRRAA